ncbi:MAG: preprotein translocase subunit YajC [Sphaerochaeta sp.]|uniref:preprotein translocase subunit YajC n=1 Tax=Sphaerochaeta sp. S2 TaxID=2798868 RepID=UPI0018E9C5BB|nr:preprotein translocase subunit YajC [Sphaerochaeta sp. S2]MCK9347683.1 preprotein translocase subunit YajC [Sphaerochaeta sp.]MBJ2357292.1 preprotein translocase subunit YajC [Sphaerochaeta sp. S2]MDD4300958.1 preprotein translocase subunit YajC [Sphaerochaeta sp.]MDD4646731.1 preprotein translocase subunit YajC [Sphaerochaeta sp.]MDY0243236.1 preprotein translocase subunit YajC [Sphaerochaeta sp.]
MLSLISAMAAPETAGAAGSTGSMMTTFVTFGLIIVIFYFLIIRPQKKRDKETKEMLSSIKKGDKVVSIGGIHGTVVAVKETTVVVKVDDNTRMEFSRNAISSIVNRKGDGATASSKKKSKKEEQVSAPEKSVEAPVEEVPAEAEAEKKDK